MVAKTSLPLIHTTKLDDERFDTLVYIGQNLEKNLQSHQLVFNDLSLLKKFNKNFENEITFTVTTYKHRVVYSPTGPLTRDHDDVRRVADATVAAIEKAIKTGGRRPLLINTLDKNLFKQANEVMLLAALEAAHIPLEVREANNSDDLLKVEHIGFLHDNVSQAELVLRNVTAIELGRIVTRDIGGSDPERMTAANVLAYVNEALKGTSIKINVVEGQEAFKKHYPLFAAVDRAANTVPRHRGRVIKLEYNPEDESVPIDTTLFLVGKGITYDTGGADVKAGGHMAGMHRDKCGAAFVAGFFKTLTLLKPRGLKVYGTLCMARNSIGEESYVADEIITARSGRRVRVGNTDAEGRMVMADLLCEAKEQALNETNPHLFTIATLTGHVIRAYGPNYTAVMSNGPGRAAQDDRLLQEAGDLIGDPYEISTIRRDDFKTITGKSEYEDLLQSTNNPSTAEPRGHQFPAAFLIMSSGLDKHGNDSEQKLAYSHVDIAGSSGDFPGKPTGAPLPSFFNKFILPRI